MPKKTNKTNHVLNLLVNGNQVKSAVCPPANNGFTNDRSTGISFTSGNTYR